VVSAIVIELDCSSKGPARARGFQTAPEHISPPLNDPRATIDARTTPNARVDRKRWARYNADLAHASRKRFHGWQPLKKQADLEGNHCIFVCQHDKDSRACRIFENARR
jgi:hypothetical protein